MSDALTLPPKTPPVAPEGDAAKARAARRLAILGRVAEVGLKVLEALEAQAEGGPVVVEGDLALAVDRVARAVRQTLMLQAKLEEDIDTHRDERAAREGSLKGSAARLVREAIEDEAPHHDKAWAKRVSRETAERLRGEDFGDLLTRPFGEAVADLCRAIGLTPDWLRLAEDCYAVEAALNAKPGQAPPEPEEIEIRWLDSTRPRVSDSS
jgi:hypothetical protein